MVRPEKFGNFTHHIKSLTDARDTFESTFEAFAKKSGVEAEDWSVHGLGFLFRPRSDALTTDVVDEVREALAETRAIVKVVDEGPSQRSLFVSFQTGGARGVSFEQAKNAIERMQDAELKDVFDIFDDYFDDFEWFLEWDTDEEMYAQPGGK